MWRRSAAPDVGRHRNERHTGDEAARHGEDRRGGRGRENGDALCAGHPFGHRGGGADEVASAQREPADAHGVVDVVPGCDGGRIERGEQHVSEATGGTDTEPVDPIERVASREVYRNPWMTVREDAVRRQDGSPGIYGVIDKPTYALVIAQDGDMFRLVEQFRYPLGLRRWEFPQGTAPGSLDGGEPVPAELAARELREETGLRAESMVALGQLDVAPGMSSQRGWVWLATGLTEGEHDREHEEQDMRSAWFARAEIEAMILDGGITDAQTIAAWTLLHLAGR